MVINLFSVRVLCRRSHVGNKNDRTIACVLCSLATYKYNIIEPNSTLFDKTF